MVKGIQAAAFATSAVAAAAAGISWRYSVLLTDARRRPMLLDEVLAADEHAVTLRASRLSVQPGTWGLRFPDGLAMVGPVLRVTDGTVVRPLLRGPVPPPGPAGLDPGPFDPDPGARGLAFTDVVVDAPAGPCPAWLVPGEGTAAADWVLFVHGRHGQRREALRVLPAVHALGCTALAVTYRNDVEEGAPASTDGLGHLGDTEWLDVEAAIRFALDRGARRVVLYGWSMGAAITAALVDRSALARHVVAMVWDAPVIDWRATLRRQARNRWLPASLIRLVTALTRRRVGIDFDRFDLLARPPAMRPPTLLVHSAMDTAVPPGPSRALAAAAPALGWDLRYLEVADVEHTASWNADPQAYEQAVTAFLGTVLDTQPAPGPGTMVA
ncbi:alpha/beta hydrolase family protein [Pseudonocardia sp. CA-107938]|uniref:alpha/beta hydrolase family protein n=1 Tax=Pseudonocardia sp. CA-107938 TaxID=3240021 RepID=UPI003D945495